MLAMLGDSVTTDHISPAGAIKKDSPAAKYLNEHGVEHKDFNSYGSRRGNHEVMMRGTFANIRLRNQLGGQELMGGVTLKFPDGDEMSIYDAAMQYAEEGTPLVVLAGQGVRLGLLARLGGQGHEPARREGGHRASPSSASTAPTSWAWACCRCSSPTASRRVARAHRRGGVLDHRDRRRRRQGGDGEGGDKEFTARVRIDTPKEGEYYKHGGILQFVLRQLVAADYARARNLPRHGRSRDPDQAADRRRPVRLRAGARRRLPRGGAARSPT